MKVYQSETNNYIEMKPLGKVRYVGESFGVDSLTDGEVYAVIEVDKKFGDLRIVDDSAEDYLYSIDNPAPLDGSSKGGKWEIVEDFTGELAEYIK